MRRDKKKSGLRISLSLGPGVEDFRLLVLTVLSLLCYVFTTCKASPSPRAQRASGLVFPLSRAWIVISRPQFFRSDQTGAELPTRFPPASEPGEWRFPRD